MEAENKKIFSIDQVQQLFPEMWKLRNVYLGDNGKDEGAYQPRNLFDHRMVKAVKYVEQLQREVKESKEMKNEKQKLIRDRRDLVQLIYLILNTLILLKLFFFN